MIEVHLNLSTICPFRVVSSSADATPKQLQPLVPPRSAHSTPFRRCLASDVRWEEGPKVPWSAESLKTARAPPVRPWTSANLQSIWRVSGDYLQISWNIWKCWKLVGKLEPPGKYFFGAADFSQETVGMPWSFASSVVRLLLKASIGNAFQTAPDLVELSHPFIIHYMIFWQVCDFGQIRPRDFMVMFK